MAQDYLACRRPGAGRPDPRKIKGRIYSKKYTLKRLRFRREARMRSRWELRLHLPRAATAMCFWYFSLYFPHGPMDPHGP